MRIDFRKIDQPAEALFVPGADLLSLPLAVSLLEKRSDRATVKTWLDGEPLQYSIRADSYDITADFGEGPTKLVSTSGHHFRRTLTGPDIRLEIRPSQEREEIQGQAGSIPLSLEAGPEPQIRGTVGGEPFQAQICDLRVQGSLGALQLEEQIVPTEDGYLITGHLGPHSIRQEVTRDPRAQSA